EEARFLREQGHDAENRPVDREREDDGRPVAAPQRFLPALASHLRVRGDIVVELRPALPDRGGDRAPSLWGVLANDYLLAHEKVAGLEAGARRRRDFL